MADTTKLLNVRTGKVDEIPNVKLQAALASGRFKAVPQTEFTVKSPEGQLQTVDSSDVPSLLEQGFSIPSSDDIYKKKTADLIRSTPSQRVQADIEAGLRGLTMGTSDLARKAMGFDTEAAAMRKEAFPETTPIEIAGMVAPLLVSGGAAAATKGAGTAIKGMSTAAKVLQPSMVAEAGTALQGAAQFAAPSLLSTGAKVIEGALAKKIGMKAAAKVIAGSAEGAGYGLAQTISEASLGDPSEVAEKSLLQTGLHNILIGSVFGSMVPMAGAVIQKTAGKSGISLVDKMFNIPRKIVSFASGKPFEDVKKFTSMDTKSRTMIREAIEHWKRPEKLAQEVGKGIEEVYKPMMEIKYTKVLEKGEKNLVIDTFKKLADNQDQAYVANQAIYNVVSKDIPRFIEGITRNPEVAGSLRTKSVATKLQNYLNDFKKELDLVAKNDLRSAAKAGMVDTSGLPINRFVKSKYNKANTFGIEGTRVPITGKSLARKFVALKEFQRKVYSLQDEVYRAAKGTTSTGEQLGQFNRYMGDILTDPAIAGDDVAQVVTSWNESYSRFAGATRNLQDNLVKEIGGMEVINAKKIKTILANAAKGDPEAMQQVGIIEEYIAASKMHAATMEEILGKKLNLTSKFDALKLEGKLAIAKNTNELQTLSKGQGFFDLSLGQVAGGAAISGAGLVTGDERLTGAGIMTPFLMRSFSSPKHWVRTVNWINGLLGTTDKLMPKIATQLLEGGGKYKNVISPLIAIGAVKTLGGKTNVEYDYDKVSKIADHVNDLALNPSRLAQYIGHNTATLEKPAPQITSQIGATTANAVQFLASKTPKNPVQSIIPSDNNFKPSTMDLDRFARYLNAVANPKTILDNIASGSVSSEEIETLKAVYPALLNGLKKEIVKGLSDNPKSPNYQATVILSKIFDRPMGNVMNPSTINLLQQNWANVNAKEKQEKAVRGQAIGKLADRYKTETERLMTR